MSVQIDEQYVDRHKMVLELALKRIKLVESCFDLIRLFGLIVEKRMRPIVRFEGIMFNLRKFIPIQQAKEEEADQARATQDKTKE